ncbi:reverse transcriptase domain-containing protein [Tanacetum coccineum]
MGDFGMDIQEKDKKKAKNGQNRARNGKDKVKSKPKSKNTRVIPTPVVSIPSKEPEQNPETSMDKVQKPSSESTAQVPPPEEEDSIFIEIPKPKAKKIVNVEIQDLNSPRPNSYQSKLPYPERMKVRENDKPSAQHSRFLKMFKQLCLEIVLKYALVEMPKFNKWLSSLLRNKEKLEEIAITTVNAECSAIIMNKVPEKLEDPGKFLIPCALQELDRTSALADSGASINLLPHSIYKQLGLGALTPTRMKHSSLPIYENPLFNEMEKDVKIENSNVSNEPVLLQTPLSDKVECFSLEDDIDEDRCFYSPWEVSSNFRGKGYFVSERRRNFFLDISFLSDDTNYNIASEVISRSFETSIQNESSITLFLQGVPSITDGVRLVKF